MVSGWGTTSKNADTNGIWGDTPNNLQVGVWEAGAGPGWGAAGRRSPPLMPPPRHPLRTPPAQYGYARYFALNSTDCTSVLGSKPSPSMLWWVPGWGPRV
jgi:hypothetical protein